MYKDKLNVLKMQYIDDEEGLELIEDSLKNMVEYVNVVTKNEISIQFNRLRGEVYREVLANLDAIRTTCHDSALVSINIINKMAIMKGLKAIFDVTGKNRTEIADDVIMPFVKEYFDNRYH